MAPTPPPVASYLFAWAVAGLAVVLYLALRVVLRAQDVLHPVPDDLCGRRRHLPHVRQRLSDRHAFIARRVLRDLRTLASNPAALAATPRRCWPAPPRSSRSSRGRSDAADGGAAAAPAPVLPLGQAQQTEFERWYTTQPRVPIAVPNDGAKVLIVQVQRLSVPAVPADVHGVQADHRQVRRRPTRAR